MFTYDVQFIGNAYSLTTKIGILFADLIYSNKSIKKTIIVATSTSSIVTAIIILISILVFWKNRQEKKKLILALHQSMSLTSSTTIALVKRLTYTMQCNNP
jgi:membrane-associated PAP2 superfamily phosphatase